MPTFISPLVNVQEIDLSTTVPTVATSVAAIVLRNTYKGPEMERQYITSENQLIRIFGKPRKRIYDSGGSYERVSSNFEDMFSAIGYLREGNSLYCTRVMPPSASFAGVKMDSTDEFVKFESEEAYRLDTITMDGQISDPDDFHNEADDLMGTDKLQIIASSRGYWGNNIRFALINRQTQVRALSGDQGDLDDEIYNIINSIDSPLVDDYNFLLIVQSKEQGASNWETMEVHNVSTDEGSTDDQGRSNFVEKKVNGESDYIRIAVAEDYNDSEVPSEWVTNDFKELGGGFDYHEDPVATDAAIIEGYELYKNPEEVDVNVFIDGNKSEEVKRSVLSICESRWDAILFADVKYDHVIKNKGNEATDIVNWRKGIDDPDFNVNSSYVATYGNWLNVFDKYNNEYHWVPASGFVAGLLARTDEVSEPWFAIAGLNRGILKNVRKLAWNPDQGNRDLLYKNGINPIASFAGQGKVIWGQKTMLDRSSAFNRINVRRLFIVLEKSISTSAKYFLFEPNDRFTRTQLKDMITPFLRDVESRRGIYDFYVQIDEENNTPERIDRNELWASIFIKPTRAAEFINLQFIATRTGANFEELIGSV